MFGSIILVGIVAVVLWLTFSTRTDQLDSRVRRLESDLSKLKALVDRQRAEAGPAAKAPEEPPVPMRVTPIPAPAPEAAAALANPPVVTRAVDPVPPPGEEPAPAIPESEPEAVPAESPTGTPLAAFDAMPPLDAISGAAVNATPGDAQNTPPAPVQSTPVPAAAMASATPAARPVKKQVPPARLFMGMVQFVVELVTGAPVGTVTATPERVRVAARLASTVKDSIPKRGMSAAEWEVLIGGNWLNKLGVAVFVVGVALLLGYSLAYLGPAGRIATGAAAGLALLGGGLFLERRERYALFAKPIIGGGWAILYFTAYATYNIDAARIFDQPALALLLMAPVAVGMIGHSFKYRAQAVTVIAYGLAYLAIAISPVTPFSLVAVGLLAASLLVVLHYVRWYHLAEVAVAGSYVCHYLWMSQRPFWTAADWLWPSLGMLAFYWLLFTAVTVLRGRTDARGDRMLLTVAIGNAAGFLGLSGWEVMASRPGDAVWLAGAALAAYAATSYILHARGRTTLFLFNASVGVALAAAAFPFAQQSWRLAPEWLAPYWAAEAGIVAAMGFRLRQIVLRMEGYLLCLASLVALFAINLIESAEGRQILVWITVPPVILFVYAMFDKLKRTAGKDGVRKVADDLALVFGYAATAAVARLIHMEVPGEYLGLVWLGGGLAYFEFSLGTRSAHLRGQGYVLVLLAILSLLYVNLSGAGAAGLRSPQWIIVGPAIAGLYYLFWRMVGAARLGKLTEVEGNAADLVATAASVVLALLLWATVPPSAVGLAWLAAALMLVECGLRIGRLALRWHSYAFAGLAAAAIVWINLIGGAHGSSGDPRWVMVAPALGLFYYLSWRIHAARRHAMLSDTETGLIDVPSCIAGALLVMLLWRDLPPAIHGLSWLVAGLAMFEAGLWIGRAALRYQGYAVAVLGTVALFAINMFGAGEPGIVLSRWATIVPGVGLLYYMFWRLFGTQRRETVPGGEIRLADLASGAAAAMLALLLWVELPPAAIGLVLLAAGLVLLEIGLGIGWAALRYQGYAFATLASAALFTINLYGIYGPVETGILASRWAMAAPAGGLFYYLFWRLGIARRGAILSADEIGLADLPSWLAAALFTILLWLELSPVTVALSWGAFGLALFEIGGKAGKPALRLQGHLLFGAALLRLGLDNLAGNADMSSLSQRLITAVPVIAVAYYLFGRLRALDAPGRLARFERNYLNVVYMYIGGILLVALARYELGPAHAVTAWSILMLVFLVVGVFGRERHFRVQGYFLAALTFAHCWTTNIHLTGSFYGFSERYATVAPAVAAFLVAALLCIYKQESYVDKEQVEPAEWGWRKILLGLDRHSPAIFALLGPTLAAILLYREISGNMLTIALSLEGFLVLVLGFLVVERGFRWFGLALLSVCLAKLLFIDLQNVELLYRIFSFIVLGMLLVLVSFTYTKYPNLLRRLL